MKKPPEPSRPINPYDPPSSRYPTSYPDHVEFRRLEKAFLKWESEQ